MGITQKNKFFSGVFVLTFANILIKVIGLMFKIPLQNLIGDEGMGYFNATYTIYVWLYMISTAGLPIAVSILISGSRAKGNIRLVKSIFRVTVIMFVVIGLAGMCLMIFGNGLFAKLIEVDKANLCIIAIAPTLFFICISSALRGYFQGYQNMVPTAISQVMEALGKLLIGVALAIYALNKYPGTENLHIVAAYAILGLTIGSAAGMLYLIISKFFFNSKKYDEEYLHEQSENMDVDPAKKIFTNLVKIAIPITMSASVMSLTNLIDVMIVMRRLQEVGFTQEVAVSLYGNYTSLAVPMFNLPPVLIYPISYSIIPILSATLVRKENEKALGIVNSSLKVCSIIITPCAIGMSVLSKPILSLFYPAASVERAAPLLSILALSSFFVGILSITNAILQSYGHENKPIIAMVSGAIVKLITSYILIGIPNVNIFGTPVSTFLCYLTITVINMSFVKKYVGFVPNIRKVFLKPFLSSALCGVAAILTYKTISGLISINEDLITVASILVAGVVYVLAIFFTKTIDKDDIMLIPKGQKIYRVLNKLKLIKD